MMISKKVKSYGCNKTLKQLNNWSLKFQKLYMTKSSFDFYRDGMIYVKKFFKFFI